MEVAWGEQAISPPRGRQGTAGDGVGQKWRVQDRCINGVGTVKGQLVEGTGTVWGQHGVSVGLYGDGLGTT